MNNSQIIFFMKIFLTNFIKNFQNCLYVYSLIQMMKNVCKMPRNKPISKYKSFNAFDLSLEKSSQESLARDHTNKI